MKHCLLCLTLITLAGCAALGRTDVPRCEDGPRRPANPHGSVLMPAALPPPGADVAITSDSPGTGGHP